MIKPKILYSFPECAGKKFRPSNGTEGMMFTEYFCECCIHEKFMHTQNHEDKKCDILSKTMLLDTDDPEYPTEWQYGEEGYPECTEWKFWDWGDDSDNPNEPPPPEPYDPNQLMFGFVLDEFLKEKKRELQLI